MMTKILRSTFLLIALLGVCAKALAIGQATQLVVTQVPVLPTNNGAVFSTQPVVTLKDASNLVVTTDSTTVVTMTVGRNAQTVGTA